MKISNDQKSYRWHGNFSWIICIIVYVDRFYDRYYITLLIRNWLVYKGDYFLYSFTKKTSGIDKIWPCALFDIHVLIKVRMVRNEI